MRRGERAAVPDVAAIQLQPACRGSAAADEPAEGSKGIGCD
jgi:hypothetical protein